MAEAYEKSQAATPRRRAEARRRGQVARSSDLVSAAVLLTAIVLMQMTGPPVVAALRAFLTQALSRPETPFAWAEILSVGALLGRAALPLIAAVMLVAILANLLQFGFLFRIPQNEDALDIGKGFERLFAKRSRVRMIFDVVKLAVVAWVSCVLLRQSFDRIVGLQQLDAGQSLRAGMGVVFSIGLKIGILLLILGVLDYAYQRWQHERDLRMAPREVKDELRQMEGDPRTKRSRREISGALASSRLERSVTSANVLITYENQLAIAIRYDASAMTAPRVVAKGAGALVARLRDAAVADGIPIVEQEVLVRTLSKLIDIGGEVPQSLYSAVAEVLAYAAATRRTNQGRGGQS